MAVMNLQNPDRFRTTARRRGGGIARSAGRQLSLLALPLLLLATFAATLLGYNRPYAVIVAPTDDVRRVFFGFHGLEQVGDDHYRWTDGGSRICLDQLGRLPSAALSLRVLGEGAYALGNHTLELRVNERVIVSAPVPGATRRYHVLLADALAERDDDCVVLASPAVITPTDPRTLGVPFAGLSLRPLAAAQPIWPATLQLTMNLALAGLGYGLLRRVGLGAWPSALGVAGLVGLLLAAVYSNVLGPGLGLSRHLLPVVVGAGALALGTLTAARLTQPLEWAPRWVVDLLAMAGWSALLFGLNRLAHFLLGYSSVWPLKAGFYPSATPLLGLLPLAAFGLWAWLLLRRIASARPGAAAGADPAGVALVFAGALALPVILKASLRGLDSLFGTFSDTTFEYIADVPRVGDDPIGFLRNFVAIKEQLALHSSTHPPGSILLLWAVERTLGAGTVPASWVAITLSALAPLAALWLGWRIGGPRLGLLAGGIAAVMPGQLVYSVTSMDGVFNMLLAMGAVAFLLALEPGRRAAAAALAGLLIALGLFFTYAATQLFFFGLAVALVAVLRGWAQGAGRGPARLWAAARPVLSQGLIAAGVIVAIYLAIFLATGYNVVVGALESTTINVAVMRGVEQLPFLPPSLSYYVLFLSANLLAFGWYLGPWGLTSTTLAGGAALRERPLTTTSALSAGLLALIAGMALSGLFNREVERIWGFTYPLLAVLVACHALQGDRYEQRWRAGLFLCLAFAHGFLIRLLLHTGW